MRSHDLIRLLDEPGPERWAPPLQISFLDLPRKHELRRAVSRKPRHAVAQSTISRALGGFCALVPEFRAAASLSLGKLKSRTRPDSAVVAAYMVRWPPHRPVEQRRRPGEVDRIRVRTIAITAPQQAQSIGGRSLRGGIKRVGSKRSNRCSKPIRRLQLACRKPTSELPKC